MYAVQAKYNKNTHVVIDKELVIVTECKHYWRPPQLIFDVNFLSASRLEQFLLETAHQLNIHVMLSGILPLFDVYLVLYNR